MENDLISKEMIGKVEFSDGEVHHYQDGKLHRTDGPAVYHHTECIQEWYNNGKLHRGDGPAYIDGHGGEEWYKYGKRHRENGPAVIVGQFGRAEYWVEGKIHREDGPAITDMYGNEEWYIDGKLHRKDGPSVTKVGKDGDTYETQYWIDGEQIIPDDKEDCKPCVESEQPEEEDYAYLAHYHTVQAEKALLEYQNQNGENPEYIELLFMLKIVANRLATYRKAGLS